MEIADLIDYLSPEEREEALACLEGMFQFDDPAFPEQSEFVRDDAKFVAALCPARAGKSYGVGLKLFRKAMAIPGCKVLYVAKTRASAKMIMWDDVLKVIARRFGLECQFRPGDQIVHLPNGSQILLLGADANDDERDKIMGQKFALIVIDEAEAFKTDLYKFVHFIARKRVEDYGEQGQVVMIGTPHDVTSGLFYDVTRPQEQGGDGRDRELLRWSVHAWTWPCNIYQRDQTAAEIATLREQNPGVESTSWFQQMYLGQWKIDETHLCYRYTAANIYDELPVLSGGKWNCKLGLDLGWNDVNAFVVAMWHSTSPVLYIPYVFTAGELTFDRVIEKLDEIKVAHPYTEVVVDSTNKQGVEQMRSTVRGRINFQEADKPQKRVWQGLMNGALATGNIRVHRLGGRDLLAEWDRLVRDPDTGTDDDRCKNDASDASLYVWRRCFPHLARPLKPEWAPLNHLPETPDQRAKRLDAEGKAMEERELGGQAKRANREDREFWKGLNSQVRAERSDKRLDGGW